MADDSGYLLSEASIKNLRKLKGRVDGLPANVGAGARKTTLNQFGPLTKWVMFYNDSGETVPRYAVMGVKGWTDVGTRTSAGVEGEPLLKIGKPSTTFRRLYLINGPDYDGVEDKTTGWALMSGQVLVSYDSGTPAFEEGWGPKPGQWTLSKGFLGNADVLGLMDSTAKVLCCNWNPRIAQMIGVTSGSVSAGAATTSYTIQCGTGGSESDSTWTAPSAWAESAIGSGKRCLVFWANNKWEITPLEC